MSCDAWGEYGVRLAGSQEFFNLDFKPSIVHKFGDSILRDVLKFGNAYLLPFFFDHLLHFVKRVHDARKVGQFIKVDAIVCNAQGVYDAASA